MVSEPAGISAKRSSEHVSQEKTRTTDDQVADNGREHAPDHDEAKPDEEGRDQPPRLLVMRGGWIDTALDARVRSCVILGSA